LNVVIADAPPPIFLPKETMDRPPTVFLPKERMDRPPTVISVARVVRSRRTSTIVDRHDQLPHGDDEPPTDAALVHGDPKSPVPYSIAPAQVRCL
jgi:hypothetical protein